MPLISSNPNTISGTTKSTNFSGGLASPVGGGRAVTGGSGVNPGARSPSNLGGSTGLGVAARGSIGTAASALGKSANPVGSRPAGGNALSGAARSTAGKVASPVAARPGGGNALSQGLGISSSKMQTARDPLGLGTRPAGGDVRALASSASPNALALGAGLRGPLAGSLARPADRKSTRLNSSHRL